MRKASIITVLAAVLLMAPFCASAQEGRLFIPKADFSAGAQFASMSIDSDNSDFMLLLNPVTASGSVTMIAPFFEYAYKDNHAVGLRLHYMTGSALIDDINIDLLNEGMSFGFGGFGAHMNTFGVSFYHRNYFALDDRGRLGVMLEESLSYSGGRTSPGEDSSDDYTRSDRVKLSFSPGLEFFVMNNISVMLTLSMGNISYSSAKCWSGGNETGSREKFAARFGIDLLGTGFGVAFHF